MVFSTWWSWLLVILVLGIVVLVLFGGRRGPKDPDAVAGSGMVRATRRIAWLYVAFCIVGGLIAAGVTLWGREVEVRLPVAEFWPTLPANITLETPLAAVQSGGFSWAQVSVSGLGMETRLMLTGAIVVQGILAVVAGLVIINLCTAITNQTFFVPQLVKGVQQLAGVVLLGGMLWQGFEIFGGSMAAEQVLGATAWRQTAETIVWTDIHNIVGMPGIGYAWEFNFWPIGASLVLMVVAELFRQGSRVQKDAAGLV